MKREVHSFIAVQEFRQRLTEHAFFFSLHQFPTLLENYPEIKVYHAFMASEEEKLCAHHEEVVAHFLKQIADWKAYGKRAEAQAQRLIDRNRELTARVAELEEQLRKVVRKTAPHNRQLFQSSSGIKKGK